MLKSMTGYGRVKVENAYREILVEVRSVNHRYLDLNIKVPRIYGFLEDAVKKQASEVLARGKVDLYVSVRAKEGSDLKITPNMPVIDGYMAALQAVAQRYGMEQTTEDEMVGWHLQLNGHECEMVKDREAWRAAVHGITKSWT